MREIWELLPEGLAETIRGLPAAEEEITEIRVRIGRPVQVLAGGREYVPDRRAAGEDTIRRILSVASRYSLYAYEEEIRQGFLTVRGGHRLGLAGQMSQDASGRVLKYISSVNVRVAHEKKGCAQALLPWLYEGRQVCSCLIVSPPGCGKTTLLRDCIRLLSDGTEGHRGRRVGVADERFELSASWRGVSQNDLGARTDIMAGCPKREALLLLLRSMNPEILAADELAGPADMEVLREASAAGCTVLATMHGSGEGLEFVQRYAPFLREAGFARICFLDSRRPPGSLHSVRDGGGRLLWRSGAAGDGG